MGGGVGGGVSRCPVARAYSPSRSSALGLLLLAGGGVGGGLGGRGLGGGTGCGG